MLRVYYAVLRSLRALPRSWNEAHRHRGCGGEGLRVFASRMSASAGVSEGLADVSFD